VAGAFFLADSGYLHRMSTHTFEVRPNEVAGWDILHDDDPDAITNVPTKEQAVEAAMVLVREGEGSDVVVRDETHELSDTGRGLKVYAFGGLALLTVIVCLIVFTGWLSNALSI
jgi:hypothetical protein